MEVKMAITRQSDRRKGDRRQSTRRKGDVSIIKIKGEGDKGREVTVRHLGVAKKKNSSVWSGHEEFMREWSESCLTRKRNKHPR
jgi:hypothetical protein